MNISYGAASFDKPPRLRPKAHRPLTFSDAEYARRLQRVHRRMIELGLDVLVLPASTARWEQTMADSRYMTGIGGYGTEALTIITPGSAPTVYVFNRADWWRSAQSAMRDVRDGRNRWGENIAERLGEVGFKRGRIGFSGLGALTRSPDGLIPYATISHTQTNFPNAEIVDATALVQDLRSVKSAEEIAVMKRSAVITERMVDVLHTAKPGLTERQLHTKVIHKMLSEGAELPSLLIMAAEPALHHGQFVPTDRPLKRGDVIVNELEARVAGYGSQAVAPVSVGKPKDAYRRLVEVAAACFEAVIAEMRPGRTLGELIDVYRRTLIKEGGDGVVDGLPLMHARGLGDEVPAITGKHDLQRGSRAELKENMVFVVKPRAIAKDNSFSGQIGATVVVTPKGGKRLCKRPIELIVV